MMHAVVVTLLPLAQAGSSFLLGLLLVLMFVGIVILTLVGVHLFSKRWKSYEEQYVEGAERTLESLFITIPPEHLLYLQVVGLFLFFVFGAVLFGSLFAGLLLGVPAFFGPRIGLRIVKRRRDGKFATQLIDALTTLSNALKSGFTLPKAFELIHKDQPPPISQEFGIVVQELRMGARVSEALKSLLQRMPGEDLDLLVTSIGISQSVGGNLTEVFDKIAHVIRERARIQGRIRSLTAQGKLQAYVVSALPWFVALGIWVIDPTLIEPLFDDWVGYVVIGVLVTMTTIGFIIIRKICAIDI